jgi:hypothetical protein
MFIVWLGVAASKFYSWRQRYGKANEHNACFFRSSTNPIGSVDPHALKIPAQRAEFTR